METRFRKPAPQLAKALVSSRVRKGSTVCLRDFRAAADARFRRATPHPVMKPSPRPSSKDLQINGPVIEPVMARISVTVIRRDLGISKTSFSSDSFDSGTILSSFWLFTAASNFFLFFFFFQ